MIIGEFVDDHPRVTAKLSGGSTSLNLSFILDTGFAGDVKVSPETAVRLGLSYIGPQMRRLANGQEIIYRIYAGLIEWDDGPREVEVLAMDGDDLIGTGLIQGMLLHVEGTDHGEVTIEQL